MNKEYKLNDRVIMKSVLSGGLEGMTGTIVGKDYTDSYHTRYIVLFDQVIDFDTEYPVKAMVISSTIFEPYDEWAKYKKELDEYTSKFKVNKSYVFDEEDDTFNLMGG